MKTQSITLALILGALPLAAGKTAVKKVTISVDDLFDLSVIAEYTEAEDMELAKAADNPRLTRDLLVRMHKRRVQMADRVLESWRGIDYTVVTADRRLELGRNREMFALTQKQLELLKL